jgi:endonuclease/exonuclease/phosphatase family metal-dependent hydrolase
MALRLTTWNIHKGFSQFNRHLTVHELRDRLRSLAPDLVFLQEVQGLHLEHSLRHADWPTQPQHEFLADGFWQASYGHNVIYDHGHHGNAILSRHPILHSHNQDVTHLRFEGRGMLHCSIGVPGFDQPVHCVCAHLSLFARSRRFQFDALASRLESLIPRTAPLIIAGDFNDWRNHADDLLAKRMGLTEAFSGDGKPARSFPAAMPFMRLDRVYLRGLRVTQKEIHQGSPWSQISDHAALSVELEPA